MPPSPTMRAHAATIASVAAGEKPADYFPASRRSTAERIRWTLLAAFAAALPLGIAVQQAALALLLVWAVLAPSWAAGRLVLPSRRALPRSPLDLPLAVLLAALLISTAFSPAPLKSLAAYDRLWIVGAYFATYHLVRSRAEVERLVAITIAVAAAVAVYAVVQHFTGVDLSRAIVGRSAGLHAFWLGEGYRVKGFHPSGITYAHNLLFPLTFATAWLTAAHAGGRGRVALLCAWTAMVVALVYSVTRGVWLAFAVVLLLTGVLRGGRPAIAAGTGLVVLLLLLVGVDPGIRARTRSAFDLPANIGRTQIWRANLDMARERPLLGWGYGNYKTFRQPFYDRYPDADTTAHAHNDFLQMQVDGGALSLTAFVALFAVVLFHGWRGRRALAAADPVVASDPIAATPPIVASDPVGATPSVVADGARVADDPTIATEPARSVALGGLLAVVGFLVGGLTQYNFGDAEVVIYLWFTVAILLRLPTLPSGDVSDGEAQRSSPLDPSPLSA